MCENSPSLATISGSQGNGHTLVYMEMVNLLKIKIQIKLMILVYHVKGLSEKIALVDLY